MDSHSNGRINLNSGHDEARYTKSNETLVAPGFAPQFCSSVSTSKRDVQTTRPCAVIGPDRIIPQQARLDNFSGASNMQWSPTNGETSYYRFPTMPQYPEHFYPPRNISPRHTFQENMARIVVPPRHDLAAGSETMQNIPNNYPSDGSIYFSKAMKSNTSSLKHPEVPYVVSRAASEHHQRFVQKSNEVYISKFDNPGAVASQIPNTNVPMQPWHQVPVPSYHNPYGNTMSNHRHPKEFHPCPPPIYRSTNPSYKKPEHPANCFDPSYYRSADLRFEPYSVKEKYSHPRYEYGYHIPGQVANTNYGGAPKYNDFSQNVMSQPVQFPYPALPHKYVDNRITNPAEECYQKVTVGRTLPPYNVPYRHSENFKLNLDDSASNSQGKVYSYEVLEMNNRHHTLPKNVDSDKVQYEFPNTIRNINFSDNRIQNDSNYPNIHKHLPFYSHPPVNSGIPPRVSSQNMAYINKPIMENQHYLRTYESDNNSQYKPCDGRQTACNPLARIPTEFSPNIISPTDSNTSLESSHSLLQHLNQEDCGYVSQCSTTSGKSLDYNIHTNKYYHLDHNNMRMADERQTFHSSGYMLPPKVGHCKQISDMNKEKVVKQIDVRQYLQMWDEELEDNIPISSKHASDRATVKLPETQTSSSRDNSINTDQLYVLDLMNIPSDELKMYEHVQKVTKLPDNIKGYDNIELLKQFDEIVQSKPDLPITKQQPQVPNNIKYTTGIVSSIPRPISPLDVEAKISQSVIHKEVGCNFEIRPCSPVKIGIEIQVLPPSHTEFNHSVENVNYSKKVNPNTVLESKNFEESNRAFDQTDEGLKKNLGRKREKRKLKLNNEGIILNKLSKYCPDSKLRYPDYEEITEENLEYKKSVQLASLPQLDCDDDMIPIATDINSLFLDTPVEPSSETTNFHEVNKIINENEKDTTCNNQLVSINCHETNENVAINMSNNVKNVGEYPCIEITAEPHTDADKPSTTNTESIGHKLIKYRKLKSSNNTTIAQLYTIDSLSVQVSEKYLADESTLKDDYNLEETGKCVSFKREPLQEKEDASMEFKDVAETTDSHILSEIKEINRSPDKSANNNCSSKDNKMCDESEVKSFLNSNINGLLDGYKNVHYQSEKSAVISCNDSTVIVGSIEAEVTNNQSYLIEPHKTNIDTSTFKKFHKVHTESSKTINVSEVFESVINTKKMTTIESICDNSPINITKQTNNENFKTFHDNNNAGCSNESPLISIIETSCALCDTTFINPHCLCDKKESNFNNKIKIEDEKSKFNLSVLCLKILSKHLFGGSDIQNDVGKTYSTSSPLENDKINNKLKSEEVTYTSQEVDHNSKHDNTTSQSHLEIEKFELTENVVHNSIETVHKQNKFNNCNDKKSMGIISSSKKDEFENIEKNIHTNQEYSEVIHIYDHQRASRDNMHEFVQNTFDKQFVDKSGFLTDSVSEILDLSYSSNRSNRLSIAKNILDESDVCRPDHHRLTHFEKNRGADVVRLTNRDTILSCGVEDTSLSMSLYDSVESYLDDINISLDKSGGCGTQCGIETIPCDMVVRKLEQSENHLAMENVTSNPYSMVLQKSDLLENHYGRKKYTNGDKIDPTNLCHVQKETALFDYSIDTGDELINQPNSLKDNPENTVTKSKTICPVKNNKRSLNGTDGDALLKNPIISQKDAQNVPETIVNDLPNNDSSLVLVMDIEENNKNILIIENSKECELSQSTSKPLLKRYINNLQSNFNKEIIDATDKNILCSPKNNSIEENLTNEKVHIMTKDGANKDTLQTETYENDQCYKNMKTSYCKNSKTDNFTTKGNEKKIRKNEFPALTPVIIQINLSEAMSHQSDSFSAITQEETISESEQQSQDCTSKLSFDMSSTRNTDNSNQNEKIDLNCTGLEDLKSSDLAQKPLLNNENQVNKVHLEPTLNDIHILHESFNTIKDSKSKYNITEYCTKGRDDVIEVLNISSFTKSNCVNFPCNVEKQNCCNTNVEVEHDKERVSLSDCERFISSSDISFKREKLSEFKIDQSLTGEHCKQSPIYNTVNKSVTLFLNPPTEEGIQTNEVEIQNMDQSKPLLSHFKLNKENEFQRYTFKNSNNLTFRQTSVITYPSECKSLIDKPGHDIYSSNSNCPSTSKNINITTTKLATLSQKEETTFNNRDSSCLKMDINDTEFINDNNKYKIIKEAKKICQSTEDKLSKNYAVSSIHNNESENTTFSTDIYNYNKKHVVSTPNINIHDITNTSEKSVMNNFQHQQKSTQSDQETRECTDVSFRIKNKLEMNKHSEHNINIKTNENYHNLVVDRSLNEEIPSKNDSIDKIIEHQNDKDFSISENKLFHDDDILYKSVTKNKTVCDTIDITKFNSNSTMNLKEHFNESLESDLVSSKNNLILNKTPFTCLIKSCITDLSENICEIYPVCKDSHFTEINLGVCKTLPPESQRNVNVKCGHYENLSISGNCNDACDTEALSNIKHSKDTYDTKVLSNIGNLNNVHKADASLNIGNSNDVSETEASSNIKHSNNANGTDILAIIENLSETPVNEASNFANSNDAHSPGTSYSENLNEAHKTKILAEIDNSNNAHATDIVVNIEILNRIQVIEASYNVNSNDALKSEILSNIKNSDDAHKTKRLSNNEHSEDAQFPEILEKNNNLNNPHGTVMLPNFENSLQTNVIKDSNIDNSNFTLETKPVVINFKNRNDAHETKDLLNIEHINGTHGPQILTYTKNLNNAHEIKSFENPDDAHTIERFINIEHSNETLHTKAMVINLKNPNDAHETEDLSNIEQSNDVHGPQILTTIENLNNTLETKTLLLQCENVNITEDCSNIEHSNDSDGNQILSNIKSSPRIRVTEDLNPKKLNNMHKTEDLSNIELSIDPLKTKSVVVTFENLIDVHETEDCPNAKNSNNVLGPQTSSNSKNSLGTCVTEDSKLLKNSNDTLATFKVNFAKSVSKFNLCENSLNAVSIESGKSKEKNYLNDFKESCKQSSDVLGLNDNQECSAKLDIQEKESDNKKLSVRNLVKDGSNHGINHEEFSEHIYANNIKVTLIENESIDEVSKFIQEEGNKDIQCPDNNLKKNIIGIEINDKNKNINQQERNEDIKSGNNIINLIKSKSADESGKVFLDEGYKYVKCDNMKIKFNQNISYDDNAKNINEEGSDDVQSASNIIKTNLIPVMSNDKTGKTIQEQGSEDLKVPDNVLKSFFLIDEYKIHESGKPFQESESENFKCVNKIITNNLTENWSSDINQKPKEIKNIECVNDTIKISLIENELHDKRINVFEESDNIKSTTNIIKRNLIKNISIDKTAKNIHNENDIKCENNIFNSNFYDNSCHVNVNSQESESEYLSEEEKNKEITFENNIIKRNFTKNESIYDVNSLDQEHCLNKNDIQDEIVQITCTNLDTDDTEIVPLEDNEQIEILHSNAMIIVENQMQCIPHQTLLMPHTVLQCVIENEAIDNVALKDEHDVMSETNDFNYEKSQPILLCAYMPQLHSEDSKSSKQSKDPCFQANTLSPSPLEISHDYSNENFSYDGNNFEGSKFEDCWIDDVACVETVISEEISGQLEDSEYDINEEDTENDDNIFNYSSCLKTECIKESNVLLNEITDLSKSNSINETCPNEISDNHVKPIANTKLSNNAIVGCTNSRNIKKNISAECDELNLNAPNLDLRNIKVQCDSLPSTIETSSKNCPSTELNNYNNIEKTDLLGSLEKSENIGILFKKQTNKLFNNVERNHFIPNITRKRARPTIKLSNIDVSLVKENHEFKEKTNNDYNLLPDNSHKHSELYKNVKITKRKILTKLKESKKKNSHIKPLKSSSGNSDYIFDEQFHGLDIEKTSDVLLDNNPQKSFESDESVEITKCKISTKFKKSKKTNPSIKPPKISENINVIFKEQCFGLEMVENNSNDNNLLHNKPQKKNEVDNKIKETKSKFSTKLKASKNAITEDRKFFYSLNRHSDSSSHSKKFKSFIPLEDEESSCGNQNSTVSENTGERKKISLKIYQSRSKLKKVGKQTKEGYENKPLYSCTAIESVLREGVIIDNKQLNNETDTNYESPSLKGVAKKRLITKAAQKYIPPISPEQFNFKVRLPLPKNSLLGFQKMENICSKDSQNDFHTNDVKDNSRIQLKRCHRIPKSKPKFDDVLRTIDDMQKSLIKSKSKKDKETVPKMIIKKNEHGAHYASSTAVPKEKYNPDLTGRKWQPWVYLEKNNFIEKMIRRNKRKTLYYLAIDRYKVVPIKKSINGNRDESTTMKLASHTNKEENANVLKPLKCTIKLKSNSNEMTNRKHPHVYTSQHITTQNHKRYQAESKNY